MAEQRTRNAKVAGSKPAGGTVTVAKAMEIIKRQKGVIHPEPVQIAMHFVMHPKVGAQTEVEMARYIVKCYAKSLLKAQLFAVAIGLLTR